MVRQDEDRDVILRIVPPPAFPVHVRPGAANRSEHVSTENPGADILKAPCGECVVDPGRTTVLAKQALLKRARREYPPVQLRPADTERIVDVLIRTCSESIKRDGETRNANSRHVHASM